MSDTPDNDQFGIAIVCALANEFNAVELVADHVWPMGNGQRAHDDPNTYKRAQIQGHNVVLVRLPEMGKLSAATTVASLRSSFPSLTMLFLTGICGGNPNPEGNTEILLGDVIIGKSVVQYDLGRMFPDGFETKDTVSDRLGRLPKNARSLIAMLETARERYKLQQDTLGILERRIQYNRSANAIPAANYSYPGTATDRLFLPAYRHKHQSASQCATCVSCTQVTDPSCEESRKLSCKTLGCSDDELVFRERLEEKAILEAQVDFSQAQKPKIFFGCIASGDTVLKSGSDRDSLAEKLSKSCGAPVLAFEMEGAGAWDEMPCIVVKGVCDYADSHKNKDWQDFAAATAASVTRAIIERIPVSQTGTAKAAPSENKQQAGPALNGVFFNGPVYGKNFSTGHTFHGGNNTFNFS